MALDIACLPRIVKVTSSGLSAASIKGLTPGEMEALSNKEVDLARIVMNAAEAKMLGVQESGLATLLRSNIKNIKGSLSQTKVDEQSIVLPYIQRTQRSYINANYFTVTAGGATPGAGTGQIPSSAWRFTVSLGASWLKTDLDNLERYFLPGATIIVMTWDSTTTKNANTIIYTIVAASNASGTTAYVDAYPNVDGAQTVAATSTWAGLPAGDATHAAGTKTFYQPTFGVIQTGANSISDREAWCYNSPADLSRKIIVSWLQTSRFSRQIDGEYQRTLDAIMKGKVNAFMQGFQWNSVAEQNKRAAQLEDDAWLRSVFYGQRLNDKQTSETYTSLPGITDVNDVGGTVLEYKANALGILQILTDCNRVIDLNGGDLDLDYIFGQLYYIKRYRTGDGDAVSVIDCMTDRLTAGRIYDSMARYYKMRYGVDTVRYAKIGEKVQFDGQTLFNYNVYDIPDQGVQWAVYHDVFFDDMISAMPATVGAGVDFKARGRVLWFLDWSDIVVGIAGTKSVKRKQPDPETNALYKCVISANVTEYNLRSTKWTVMVDRPSRHLIIQNFSGNCPTVAAAGCSAPNP